MTQSKSKAKAEEQQNDPTVEQESGEVSAVSEGIEPVTATVPDGYVTVKMAHPLTRKQDYVFLGLDPAKRVGVNDEIQVSKNGARALITAGLVQVDPENKEAVKTLLSGGK